MFAAGVPPIDPLSHPLPARAAYAAAVSLCACAAVESLRNVAPTFTAPGRNPVIVLPGLTPRLPVTIVAPELVTADPPRTAKLAAAPSDGGAGGRARTSAGNPAIARNHTPM